MFFINKALVTLEEGELVIKIREVARNAPINRILDVVGFYAIDGVVVNDHKYLMAYMKEEFYTKKTKCLFTKITEEGIVSVQEDDFEEILTIARDVMAIQDAVIS